MHLMSDRSFCQSFARIMLWYLIIVLLNNDRFIQCSPVSLEFNDDWDPHTISNKNALLNSESKTHQLPPLPHRQGKENYDPLQELHLENKINLTTQLGNSIRNAIPCTVCKLGVGLLYTAVRNGEPLEIIRAKFVSTCVGFNIQNEVVCSGVFDVFSPDVLAALKVTKLGPKEICGMFETEVCEDEVDEKHVWTINTTSLSSQPKKERTLPEVNKPTLKVLQISDTHLDLEYLVGSNANCDEPLCCRLNSSLKKKKGVILPAGRWGMYKCDTPKILMENMLQNIARQHPDIDYIMWTGDIPPHDVWNQTKNGSLQNLVESVKLIRNAFPKTVILPAIGNHEGIPAGNFPPPWNKDDKHSIDWLYNELNKQWEQWLPKSEKNSILRGGFFSVLIQPGFRLISLNTNYCYIYSWWLYVNSTDPAKELKWFVDQLQQAEMNNEKVHIIGHIPPGSDDCLKVWSRNYYEIISKFEHVVTAQFFGHTHSDEYEMFYDHKNDSRPINVAYIAPSVTPFSGQNPAYRIYYVDGNHETSTREVIDHETWILDLDKANSQLENNPKWFKLYSARESYEMPNLSPLEWHRLIYKMVLNEKIFDQFYRNYHRSSPVSSKYSPKEKLQMLCDLKSGKSNVRRVGCRDLELLLHV